MREADGVKAYTASDPLDVLPTVCAFIAVMCENRNRKKTETGTRDSKTESNQIWKIQTDPALIVMYR